MPDHAGGWSVDASVTIPGWDRHGLERLVRYCVRPPLSQERLGRVDDLMLVYSLRKATVDGRTELYLTPLELLDRLAQLITPPRIHKHRYCGVLAPNARLRQAVIERRWNRCAIPPAAITLHVGEPVAVPAILPARSPPQGEIQFDQVAGPDEWPDMDQTAGVGVPSSGSKTGDDRGSMRFGPEICG